MGMSRKRFRQHFYMNLFLSFPGNRFLQNGFDPLQYVDPGGILCVSVKGKPSARVGPRLRQIFNMFGYAWPGEVQGEIL